MVLICCPPYFLGHLTQLLSRYSPNTHYPVLNSLKPEFHTYPTVTLTWKSEKRRHTPSKTLNSGP